MTEASVGSQQGPPQKVKDIYEVARSSQHVAPSSARKQNSSFIQLNPASEG